MVGWCVERLFAGELALIKEEAERLVISRERADTAAMRLREVEAETAETLARMLNLKVESEEMKVGPGVTLTLVAVANVSDCVLWRFADVGGQAHRAEYYAHAMAAKLAPLIEAEIAKRVVRRMR